MEVGNSSKEKQKNREGSGRNQTGSKEEVCKKRDSKDQTQDDVKTEQSVGGHTEEKGS